MKNTTKINFRIPEYLKEKIEHLSEQNNISTSKMARKMIEDYDENIMAEDEKDSQIWKHEIVQLVSWLYRKRLDPKACDDDYDDLIAAVYRVIDSKYLSLEIKHEFSKVEEELNTVLDLPSYDHYYFQFAIDTNPNKFNFKLLENFINEPIIGQTYEVYRS
ncbi:hypothetical protein SAMN06265371_103232 [Lutibacter agarilyticus]|uniref:Ribbon-helix-helix protein, copG family n=1 Tax=Lutibacter agarilyticus TaxID=1109740 RepID=A0A238WIB1_9FLAO|nr:hypothetical protein [Lutibacter agarilyticus]SNR46063.1 hypothetical protein SAMN06265371_103232 [Lutibacter agarilyticus]